MVILKSDYIIAIPSYHRAEICNNKTLTMLHLNHIDKSKIYVYVADKEEYDIYFDTLDPRYYNKIIIGIKGLVQQREFIMKKWPQGKLIVFLDDDFDSIDLSISPTFKSKGLNYFIEYAFKECIIHKSFIWGVYPVYNPFFRKARKEITTELKFICGGFYGIINRPSLKSIELTISKNGSHKEDTERTLKYYIQDGIVIRFDKVGFITKNFSKQGGMGNFEERLAPLKEATLKLQKQYSEYGHIKIRKNGMYEFVLYSKPRLSVQNITKKMINKSRKTQKQRSRRK
jgi:hypothetical protein